MPYTGSTLSLSESKSFSEATIDFSDLCYKELLCIRLKTLACNALVFSLKVRDTYEAGGFLMC
jgi:hypothetical protein